MIFSFAHKQRHQERTGVPSLARRGDNQFNRFLGMWHAFRPFPLIFNCPQLAGFITKKVAFWAGAFLKKKGGK
jgi:hypothetical protein